MMFNCWNAWDYIQAYYTNIIVNVNGGTFKPYLMNFVYNFGHIFDNLRDVYLFLTQDPRGQINNVFEAGYDIGTAFYFIITPGIASYKSTAVAVQK